MGRTHHTALAIWAVAISFMLFCSPSVAAEPDGSITPISWTKALRVAVQNRVTEKFSRRGEARSELKALIDYYSDPEGCLLWVDDAGLTPRANSVIEEIEKADDYGLRASDYDLPKLDAVDPKNPSDVAWLADAEIKISLAVLRYARDARGGRLDPQRLSENFDPILALPDPLQVMKSIAICSDPAVYLRSFQPDQPQFEALRKALIAARGQSVNDHLIRIPDGPALKLGVAHDQVALLRTRLQVVEADAAGHEKLFDTSVEQAVKHFQAQHGVQPDGVVGPGTRRLLNQPPETANSTMLKLILINMERWRWLPNELGSYYVTVNVPEFTLRVMAEGKTVHTARVVVGKQSTQTPIFSNQIQEIVFNPYWSVPTAIKVEAIRPYITSESGGLFGRSGWNTAVLKNNNLRIKIGGREVDPSTLDWNRLDIKALNIYQPPGPENVLGTVKFVFPNKHDVYMHDTPHKFVFPKRVRAASHGCVRVENPDQLALILLQQDQGWTAAKVAAAIQNGYDQHVALLHGIPIYVTYFTRWVNGDSSISTFGDVYGHDARMAAALFGNRLGFDRPAGNSQAIAESTSRIDN